MRASTPCSLGSTTPTPCAPFHSRDLFYLPTPHPQNYIRLQSRASHLLHQSDTLLHRIHNEFPDHFQCEALDRIIKYDPLSIPTFYLTTLSSTKDIQSDVRLITSKPIRLAISQLLHLHISLDRYQEKIQTLNASFNVRPSFTLQNAHL